MAFVADWQVIKDGPVTIETGGDIDWDQTFDLDTWVAHSHKKILQADFESAANAHNLDFRFSINGTPLRRINNVTGKHFGSVHEVIGQGITHDHQNTIKVEIVGGTGRVRISDIVLFAKQKV